MRGRRRCLVAGAAGLIAMAPSLLSRPARAHVDAGPLDPPLAVPDLAIRWHDGSRSTLAQRLRGRVTAVQTMFTTCSVTCPLQGALFAAVQDLLAVTPAGKPPGSGRVGGADDSLQLLSLSIDPMNDEPPELDRWRDRFGAGTRWAAGAPVPADVDRMLDFLRARSDRIDRHTGQVYLFNRRAELVLRTVDLPPAEQVAALLRQLQAIG